MEKPLHHRAFVVTVVWTLFLLFLGSVVHATESSLACPDWPTCYGSMVPEMEGGIFWEHLHRLVAGGLLFMFGLATWLAWREAPADRRWIVKACIVGMGLLVVQAVFGGLTVLMGLPDAISTTHLGLALLFLILAVVLAAASSPARASRPSVGGELRGALVLGGGGVTGLVLLQSLLGGAVRHMDAGMACGPGLLCNAGLLPPAWNDLIAVQFAHRVMGVLVAGAVVALAVVLLRRSPPPTVRRAAWTAVGLVAAQVVLGFLSTATILAVTPVSLHTLVAASLLAVGAYLWAFGWLDARGAAGDDVEGEAPARAHGGTGPATGGSR